eukprot:438049_1
MLVYTLLGLLAICKVSSEAKFVSYIGKAGPTWVTTVTNEDWLKYMGVPGYGGSRGYTVLNFAFWVSSTGAAASNGAAYDWQTITSRITSSSLKSALTGTSYPTADQLREGIKRKYSDAGIKILISAFGANDHPKGAGKSASAIGIQLAQYVEAYNYDGVDVDWEEGEGGASWLCSLTNALRSNLASDKLITHAPQAPYFMSRYGFVSVHSSCGSNIDWYNIQFYNQGSTTYNTYSGLFERSIGWSSQTAVYEIMDDSSNQGVRIPHHKIIVGKHTLGDGSTFVNGQTLKQIFDSALSISGNHAWYGGFMSWQFYAEITAPPGQALIDYVLQSNWARAPTPPPSPTIAPPPTTPPACSVRCGSSWSNAMNTCGTCCTNNAQCGRSAPYCYAALSTDACGSGGSVPNPVPPPTPPPVGGGGSSCSIRCGSSWGAANSRCGTCCTANGQCGGSSPYCYRDLSLSPCQRYSANDDKDNESISWTVWFSMGIFIVLAIGIIIGIVVYLKYKRGYVCMKKGKGYVSKTDDKDAIELKDNDGNNMGTVQQTEMIDIGENEVENENEVEIEVEVENETEIPMTN